MPRSVKAEEHTAKRNEILDAARKLVYTKGYEQMTIQDILDDLHISKGAFYHYFDSKQTLLPALIDRMWEELERRLHPIVRDAYLSALEKLRSLFTTGSNWKTEQKAFLFSLLRVWYRDDNAIVRVKVRTETIKRTAPLYAAIIYQGIQEGILATDYPDQCAEVVAGLILDLGDAFAQRLLSSESQDRTDAQLEGIAVAYTDALERVLGAPSGSLELVETLREWMMFPSEHQ